MRVEVLGPLVVRRDGEPVGAGGPTQRAVLTVLGLHGGRTVGIDRLADAVWDGRPPRTADHTLHNYVLRLRRLGLLIARDGDGYLLQTPTDAEDLERVAATPGASTGELVRAAGLVRGRPGGDLADSAALQARCRHLGELCDLVADAAAAALLADATGAVEAAALVPGLRSLAEASPYRERRWELLMLGLYRAGRQAEALDAYARVHALLRDELGVDPGPELRRMQQRVLSQDPSLRPDGTTATAGVADGGRALPGLTTRFVGRARETQTLARATASSRLVTLAGPLGAGKTRLALQAAYEAVGPAWFVPLEGLPVPTSVARAVLGVVSPASVASDPLSGSVTALADSDGLLVLDAAEHRRDEVAAVVTRLLTSCPRLRILVTSRHVLGLRDEATVRVGPLGLQDGLDLLVDRARLADPAFHLGAQDMSTAQRLCALVDGLPLGIELVSRHLRLLDVPDLAARVDADLDRWTAGADGDETGMVSAVATAVAQVAPAERAVLARLAVLPAEADLVLAGAVAAPDSDEEQLFGRLAGLVDRSLVQVRSGPDGLRYALLLSVRRHCLALLDAEEQRRTQARYVTAVLRRCASTAGTLASTDRGAGLRRLDADLPHLRAALTWCLDGSDGDAEQGLTVAAALTDYWLARQPGEGLAWLQRLLPASSAAGPARAAVLLQMGHLAYWLTAFDLGTRLLEEARSLVSRTQDPLLLGRILRRLGAIAAARDDIAAAHDLLAQSAEALRDAGDPTEEAVSLLHLGTLLADEGHSDQALPVLVRAREAFAGADPLREALALSALTLAWWKAGDLDAALGAGSSALAGLRALGHQPTEAVVGYRMAAVARAAGQGSAARAHAQHALTLGEATGTRTTIALAHERLARLDLDDGAAEAAAAHLAVALDELDPGTDRWVLAELLETTARLQLVRGRPVTAVLDQAAALRELIGQPPAPAEQVELAALRRAAGGDHGPGPAAEEPAALRTWARALATPEPSGAGSSVPAPASS